MTTFYIKAIHRWLLTLLLVCPVTMFANETLVTFSCQGGFYEKPFHLILSCPKEYTIHYTINGSTPTFSDLKYEKPLLLDQSLYSHSDIYTIQECSDEEWYAPDSIRHIIILRAAAFDEKGERYGEVTTNSYVIKSLGNDFHNLPIVSLCLDSLSLFDYETGIFVQGVTGSNSFQRGREWERSCNFEFYETGSKGYNQPVGLRTHGMISRGGLQKGMKLYARKEYGISRLHYPFFESNDNKTYKHLVLKPFWNGLYRDHVCTEIARELDFEAPASRPVVVFLNGEYWGLYFLKERPDAQFIADHYGYKKKDVNVIESWYGDVTDGDSESFKWMMQWMMQADLANDSIYQLACQIIDVNCFIDYYCFQFFVNNEDWPDNNMRCWQVYNGKWRWIFFDGDYSFVSYLKLISKAIVHENNKDASTYLFTKMLSNDSFRNQFYQRFGTLLTHEFYSKETHKVFHSVFKSIEYEIEPHFQRFGLSDFKSQFDFQVRFLDDFLTFRIVSAAGMIYDLFYVNNWEYQDSKSSKHVRFYQLGKKRPTFLFRMARQFKDWRYVSAYFSFERYRIRTEFKGSGFHQYIKSTKLWKKAQKIL